MDLLCVILLLQFGFVYNRENNCGCGVNNDRRTENIYSEAANEKSAHCTKLNENKHSEYDEDSKDGMVLIPTDEYQVGTDDIVIETDMEGPKKTVNIKSFYLDKFEVSNRDFSNFAKLTNYKTEAEIFGDSFVFTLFLNNTIKEQLIDFRVVQAPWWYKVTGANWQHPHGPGSNLSGGRICVALYRTRSERCYECIHRKTGWIYYDRKSLIVNCMRSIWLMEDV
ncbi:hypothetical protein evm_014107 [Chilo suppressalis]|nr:hypothetical protein evm_014107 [Chilo suppressalis]